MLHPVGCYASPGLTGCCECFRQQRRSCVKRSRPVPSLGAESKVNISLVDVDRTKVRLDADTRKSSLVRSLTTHFHQAYVRAQVTGEKGGVCAAPTMQRTLLLRRARLLRSFYGFAEGASAWGSSRCGTGVPDSFR